MTKQEALQLAEKELAADINTDNADVTYRAMEIYAESQKPERHILIIGHEDGSVNMSSKNFSSIEILGMLRFQEKYVWLQMINSDNPKKQTNEQNPEPQR
jgi:hypothetical protein